MKLEFTAQEVNAYLKALPTLPAYFNNAYLDPLWMNHQRSDIFDPLHPYYLETLLIAEAMKVHADGFFPYKLIKERRPNETLEVLNYRAQIWIAKTKPTFNKVMSSLAKIRRSADWSINWSKDWAADFSKVAEGETLEDYCDYHFPFFTSVTNWIFTLFLRKYLIDPNAVCLIKPKDEFVEETDFLKPIPEIFDSIHVLDFVADDFAVLLNPYGAVFYDGHGRQQLGHSVFFVTTQQIIRYDQINIKKEFKATAYDHNLGILPAFKLGGLMINQVDNYFLFESSIAGMIPELDEAVREYSDLQAAKVLHIYPERWEYTNTECKQCNGIGKIPNARGGADLACEGCGGTGYVNAGPYSKMIITPNKVTDGVTGAPPTPPAGFIEKDVEIVKIQDDSVNRHLYDALAAINFEFLANAPLTQSGTAKQYDRNESNNTTHAVAENLVAAMDKLYKITAQYRYGKLYPDPEDLENMLPTIAVPENYDLYSIADSQDELNKAKTGNTNPVILNALETEFAGKRFYADPKVQDRVMLVLQLDPLPNISEDDKMSRLSNKGVSVEDYTISSNIQSFAQRAINENEKFCGLPLVQQQEKMSEYAQELIKENVAAASAKVVAMQAVGGPGAGGVDPNTGKLIPSTGATPILDPAGNPVPNPALPAPPPLLRAQSKLP